MQCLCGAYPRGHCRSLIFGEKFPHPALGVQGQPLRPRGGAAHNGAHLGKVCLGVVGVPFNDHLIVDVEHHLVARLAQVVQRKG